MKRIYRLFVITGVLLIIFDLHPLLCNAQPPDDFYDPDAPIDGGVGLLVAAGIGYGIKKARDKRKQNNTAQLAERNKE